MLDRQTFGQSGSSQGRSTVRFLIGDHDNVHEHLPVLRFRQSIVGKGNLVDNYRSRGVCDNVERLFTLPVFYQFARPY